MTVQTNIPLPPRGHRLAVTQAILRPLTKPGLSIQVPQSVNYRGLYRAAKTLGIKIATRKVSEDGWNGYRCWRIA